MRLQDRVNKLPGHVQTFIRNLYSTESNHVLYSHRQKFTAQNEDNFLRDFAEIIFVDSDSYFHNAVVEFPAHSSVSDLFLYFENVKACLTLERCFVQNSDQTDTLGRALSGLKVYLEDGIALRHRMKENDDLLAGALAEMYMPATVIESAHWTGLLKAFTTIFEQLLEPLRGLVSNFKYDQRQVASGVLKHPSITFEQLTTVSLRFVEILRTFSLAINPLRDVCKQLFVEEVKRFQKELLHITLLIEKQPSWPFVLNKAARVLDTIKVTSLIGSHLGCHLTPTTMTASIVQMSKIVRNNRQLYSNVKKFSFRVNNKESEPEDTRCRSPTVSMDPIYNNSPMSFTFSKLKPGRLEGKEDSGTKVLKMEIKWCLYFESEFTLNSEKIRVELVSMPVTVSSHSSQDPLAMAAILWYYAFAKAANSLDVPEKAPWEIVQKIVSNCFLRGAGREPNKEQLNYLKKKAFGSSEVPNDDNISYKELCKVNFPGKDFTPWDWIFGAIKILYSDSISRLSELWRRGVLHGVMERKLAVHRVQQGPPGALIIRFADSMVGALTYHVKLSSQGNLKHADPGDFQHLLNRRTLAEIVKEDRYMKYLYTSDGSFIPKDEAFGSFSSARSVRIFDGYDGLILTIE